MLNHFFYAIVVRGFKLIYSCRCISELYNDIKQLDFIKNYKQPVAVLDFKNWVENGGLAWAN